VKRVYTIGHSNRPTEHLVARLKRHGVKVLADVRSRPFSRHNPQFNRYEIAEVLRQASIPYVWMGHALGGMPDDPALKIGGRADYAKIRRSQPYQDGLEDLVTGLESPLTPVALMCSEQDPSGCHRRRLVGVDLVSRGYELVHILGDGELATEHDIREGTGENQPSVLDLFSD